ncbi:4-hydroxyphenylpyruvate dioxygenase [Acidobacteria bacterium ACD]|nr:MAG: 4-hydroxyphenylpyruvate dioxygenase [Acidobacteriota bacterium]MDL1949442.1 4-hydroxyphenylpyruvate dioxygenase [Acidobacteria bacterium ACD]
MSTSLGLIGYDSFHFIVKDLERSRRFYTDALGFTEVARASDAKVERGGERASVFGAGQVRVLVSTPARGDSRAARYLRIHPDGISSLAFRVRDVEASWAFLEARGATFLSGIQEDEAPSGKFRTFSIATPLDDVTFRFIQREGDYPRFAPDFETVGDGRPKENPHGFSTIDHVTSNAYTMLPVVNWYRDVLGFTHYWDVEFHTTEVDGGKRLTGSGLRSIVMADRESGIKFATNEPMRPFFRDSQINRFCEDHHGAGVQHVAFIVKEILPAVESLRGRGIAFLPAPPAYYDRLPKRLADVRVTNVKEPMEDLRRNHVLVDGADDKYMLQIFMKDAMSMYGDESAGPFFYELIQREGDKGFGYGNFRALFESIEEQQRPDSESLEVVG